MTQFETIARSVEQGETRVSASSDEAQYLWLTASFESLTDMLVLADEPPAFVHVTSSLGSEWFLAVIKLADKGVQAVLVPDTPDTRKQIAELEGTLVSSAPDTREVHVRVNAILRMPDSRRVTLQPCGSTTLAKADHR